MGEPLSILPEDEKSQISFIPENTSQPPNPALTTNRASKVNYSLGKDSPGYATVHAMIAGGNEKALRDKVDLDEAIRWREQRNNIIAGIAQKVGGNLQPEQLDILRTMSREDYKSDPNTVFERKFAAKYMGDNLSRGLSNPNSLYSQAPRDVVMQNARIFQRLLGENQVFQSLLEEVHTEYEKQGILGTIYDNVTGVVPFVSWWRIANATKGAPSSTLSLPGKNMLEQIQYIRSLPIEQGLPLARQTIEELKGKSLQLAHHFAKALVAYGSSDQFLDSSVGVADLTAIPGIKIARGAIGLVRGTKGAKEADAAIQALPPINELRKTAIGTKTSDNVKGPVEDLPAFNDIKEAMKDAVKAADGIIEPEAVLAAAGDIPLASLFGAYTRFQAMAPDAEGTIMLEKIMISSHNPWNYFGNSTALSNKRSMELTDRALARVDKIDNALGAAVRGTRLNEQALDIAIKEAEESLTKEYMYRLQDGFLDMIHIPKEVNPANVDTVVMRLGKPGDGSIFESRANAAFYAEDIYGLKPGEYQVYRQGSSYYIGVPKHINEYSESVLDATYTLDRASPSSMINTLIGRVRTTEDLLSKTHSAQRKVATHGQQHVRKVIREAAEEIASLPRRQRQELEAILEVTRDAPNPALGPGGRGIDYATAADFEAAFTSMFKKAPTEKQVEGYFIYKQLSDFDYLGANLNLYRDKAILGAEQFSLRARFNGTTVDVPYFEGIMLEKLPWANPQDAQIVIHEGLDKFTPIMKSAAIKGNETITREYIEDLIKNKGFKVIQIFDPKRRPLKDLTGLEGEVNFVITQAYQRKPISWKQVDYNPGVHVIYPYEWYVKQAIISTGHGGKQYYYGDNSILNFATEAEAKKYVERMNIARIMLKNNDPGLGKYLSENIPFSEKQFREMFASRLNVDLPIAHTQASRNVFDTEEALNRVHPNTVHMSKNSYDMTTRLDNTLLADRDNILSTVREESGGVLRIAPATQLSPYLALQRGLNQRLRNMWLNDYKHGAVKNWIEEFKDVIDVSERELRNHPYKYVYRDDIYKRVGGEDQNNRLAAARANQRAIVNFLGTSTELGDAMTAFQNKVVSSIYGKTGQAGSEFVADHLLPSISDPARYFRAAAFHTKLGMFNPVQMFLQAQSLNHVIAVAGPRQGIPGVAASAYMRVLRHTDNPEIINTAAKKLTKFGWDAEQFKEMYGLFKSTGLYEVMGEAALRHDMFDHKLFRSTAGWFLDKGTMFFNEGERIVRLAAFATAYREWKLANKLTKIDDRALADIMQRSDLLSVNMTRASLADFQKGVFSIPTQFMSFHLRLSEQFLGKRLTTQEKLRAYVWYSAMYGIPTAAGIGGLGGVISGALTGTVKDGPVQGAIQGAAASVGAWPIYEDIRAEALKRGIDLSPWYINALAAGLPNLAISAILGKEYNFAQRYGPGGNQLIRDIMRKDKGVLEVAGGASGAIISDIMDTTMPLLSRIAGTVFGGNGGYQLTNTDYIRALRNVSSADTFTKAYGILQYGKIYSKTNTDPGIEAERVDAIAAMLGLTPQQAADIYIKQGANIDRKNYIKSFEDKAMEQYRLATQYAQQGDHKAAEIHWRNAQALLDLGQLNMNEQNRVFRRALESAGPLMDRVDEQFIRRSPDDQYSDRLKAFHKK